MSVGPLHVHLHEGSGQLFGFPRSGRLAGPKTHGDVVDPHRLPGFQSQVPNDAVALVEQAEDRDALRHRSYAGKIPRSPRNVDGNRFIALDLVALAIAARRSGEQHQRKDGPGPDHAWSGFHAS